MQAPDALRALVESYLSELALTPELGGLAEPIRYALGGKRVRPTICLATAEAAGGTVEAALPAAAALELVHSFSLVHDDLPAMDDDDLRRGRPTVHRAFDEATAILAGDALQSLAFGHLLAADDPRAAALARLLAEAATRMVEGQARDVEAEHRPLSEAEVVELMSTKTGALLAASVAGGAACAGGRVEDVLPAGLKLGLAFQIADDLLDLTADTRTLGKRAGKDAARGKATLPAILGAEEARRRAEALLAEALATLEPLGPRAEPLRAVARFVLSRKT